MASACVVSFRGPFLILPCIVFVLLHVALFGGLVRAQPDAVIDTNLIESSWLVRDEFIYNDSCAVQSGWVDGLGFRKILRFDLSIANTGESGSLGSSSAFEYNSCLGAEGGVNLVWYRIFDHVNNLVFSQYRAYCLYDMQTLNGGNGTKAIFTCLDQGLSAGWETYYSYKLDIQMFDLTGLIPGGAYTLNITLQTGSRGDFVSDVNVVIPFTNPYEEKCHPSPLYYQPTFIQPSGYIDPIAEGHTQWTFPFPFPQRYTVQVLTNVSLAPFLAANPNFTFFCTDISDTIWIRGNGVVSFNPLPTFGQYAVAQYDNVRSQQNGTLLPYYLSNTMSVLWDEWYYVNGTSTFYSYVNSTVIILTWLNVNRLFTLSNVSFQIVLYNNQDIDFNYIHTSTLDPTYSNGASATIGVCGAVANPNQIINSYQQSLVDDNCVFWSIDQASVQALSTVQFKRVPQRGRVNDFARPIANGLQLIDTAQITKPVNFYGLASNDSTNITSANLEYQWIFGDGLTIPSILPNPTHTYETVEPQGVLASLRVFDGVQQSTAEEQVIIVTPVLLNYVDNSSGDGSQKAGIIAVAVLLPILFCLCLILLLLVLYFVWTRRGVIEPGGAWWGEEPIYMNLREDNA